MTRRKSGKFFLCMLRWSLECDNLSKPFGRPRQSQSDLFRIPKAVVKHRRIIKKKKKEGKKKGTCILLQSSFHSHRRHRVRQIKKKMNGNCELSAQAIKSSSTLSARTLLMGSPLEYSHSWTSHSTS